MRQQSNLSDPAQHAFSVTPSDSSDFAGNVQATALYVGVTGDLTVDTVGGETSVLFKAVPVGFFPVSVKRVRATGTTATNIVGVY